MTVQFIWNKTNTTMWLHTISQIRPFLAERAYFIGFLNDNQLGLPAAERFNAISWLKTGRYKHGWFADPFFLSVDESKVELLVEEWEYDKKKGRLCILDVERRGEKFNLQKVTPILTLDTHLSFPIHIQDEDGELFFYPENYQSGTLKMYHFNRDTLQLENPITIIAEPLLDTQIVKIGKHYYAMGVIKNDSKTHDYTRHLCIYKAEQLTGHYELVQIISNSKREERGAGHIYEQDCKLYRPAQCCEGDYGKAVITYELQMDDEGHFTEKEVNRFEPIDGARYGQGLHTFNQMNGLCVVDGKDFRRGRISRWLDKLYRR